MMSSLSVFSGAGTILGPLISIAGPGIMVTVMSMIASEGVPYLGSVQTTSSSSSTCDITAIGTCMSDLFNANLQLGKVALDNSNGAFSVINTVMGELFTGMETLTGSSTTNTPSPSDYAHILGSLSLAKDVLGIIKTFTSNPEDLFTIQFIRTYLDAVQLFMSIEFRNEYPSMDASFLWLIKAGISTSTHILGLINDLNNVASLSWLSSYTNALGVSTFNEASQEMKMVVQLVGAIQFILYFLGHESSINQNTKIFMGLYVLQKVAKMIIFGLKFKGRQDNGILNWERALYGVSIGLNAFQMIFG